MFSVREHFNVTLLVGRSFELFLQRDMIIRAFFMRVGRSSLGDLWSKELADTWVA